jgi:hypothetical protein
MDTHHRLAETTESGEISSLVEVHRITWTHHPKAILEEYYG